MAEETKKVEAYETAVSMQNIGLHNRYGFMVDDKEVRRSSTRRRSTLSFNTSSCNDNQEQAQCQMRNHCEPKTKPPGQDDCTARHAVPMTTRTLNLSTHGPGQGNYGQRPPMQKSLSTRSFANRPPMQKSLSTKSFARNNRAAMYQRTSSRSINQSQTIEEDAQLVEDRPEYVPANRFPSRSPSRSPQRQESISKMTVSYQRRSSRSIFGSGSSSDDNLSVSDMGSVMSQDRDDDGNISVVSRKSAKSTSSKLSTALSRTSKGFRGVGKKIMKPITLTQRQRSDDGNTSLDTISVKTKEISAQSTPNFLAKMLAKRGTRKLDIEPWRALASDSPSYWADDSHHVTATCKSHHLTATCKSTFIHTPAPAPKLPDNAVVDQPIGGSRRMNRRASM
jgi:hypothetical protein